MSNSLIRRGATLLLALLLVLTIAAQDRLRDMLLQVVEWIRELGWSGALVYGLLYVVATVALLPGLILTLGAGYLYGPLWGALLVAVFSVAGASASFLLARSWWRPWALRKLQGQRALLALDERMGEEGWKIVFLLRLSPLVPFSIVNYLLGVTRLSFRDYVGASAVGMLPGILLYSYMGSALSSLGEMTSSSSGFLTRRPAPFWIGMAATLLVTLVLTAWARRALREMRVVSPALES